MAIIFGHRANAGDVIACMAGIKQVCETYKEKALFVQRLNFPGHYYDGAVHPVTHEGEQVCMNQGIFDMLRPLLLSQSYIEDFVINDGQKITVDLDVIRDKCFVNIPYGAIQTWPMLAFPDMATDISKPWIVVEKQDLLKNRVVINFTERYRNETVNYSFLKKYEPDLIFAGTSKEYGLFYRKWGLDIPYLAVDNFLDLAQSIAGARFFVGNQSFCWNLANAMGLPRILEMSGMAPNCQPFIGENNFGYFHTASAKYHFEQLFNKTK